MGTSAHRQSRPSPVGRLGGSCARSCKPYLATKPYDRAVRQASLSTSGAEIAGDATFATAKRTALDAPSWVALVPAWLSGADALFERLASAVPWKEHYRRLFDRNFLEPRLTAEYRDLREAPE